MNLLPLLILCTASAADPGAVVPIGEHEIPGTPPGPAPPADQVQDIAHAIGLKMRCPVCQGMSVADSTSPAAVNMQNTIRDLVGAGYSEEQIKDFFIERYSEWILLEPEKTGVNLIVWVAPAIAGGLGVAFAAATMLQWGKEEDEVPLPSDVGLAPKDKYEERLLAELED